MQGFTEITGMVLKAEPIGEYDRRVVILTKEKGKISAFARGARKQTSRLLAATNPFSFGTFRLYAGRSSYNLTEADISNYFEGLRTDFEGAYYGMYFLEVMDYYTRENNEDKEMLKLLYQSLRALMHEKLPNRLIRYIFEIKAMVLSGEFPECLRTKSMRNPHAMRCIILWILLWKSYILSQWRMRCSNSSPKLPMIIENVIWTGLSRVWRFWKACKKVC